MSWSRPQLRGRGLAVRLCKVPALVCTPPPSSEWCPVPAGEPLWWATAPSMSHLVPECFTSLAGPQMDEPLCLADAACGGRVSLGALSVQMGGCSLMCHVVPLTIQTSLDTSALRRKLGFPAPKVTPELDTNFPLSHQARPRCLEQGFSKWGPRP